MQQSAAPLSDPGTSPQVLGSSARTSYQGQGSDKLFFFDRFYIERLRNLEFRLHQPVKGPGNPILTPQHPWEGWRAFPYGKCILRDPADGLFKMWYETQHDGPTSGAWEESSQKRTAYATSADGLHWERPALGQLVRHGSGDNSLIDMGPFGIHCCNVIIDEHDDDPARRFKMLFYGMPGTRNKGELLKSPNVAASPDGMRWHLLRPPADPAFASHSQRQTGAPLAGDVMSLFGWSALHGRYVAFMKGGYLVPRGFRTICYSESADFINWSRLISVLAPDEYDAPGTEFYYMHVFPYADLHIGLLCIYHNYSRRANAWAAPTLECPPELQQLNDRLDVRLAYSRDLQVWYQAGDRQPFQPLGVPGTWDSGIIYPSTILDRDDETWIYYAGTPMRHLRDDLQHAGETIDGQRYGIFGGVARLRREGFVSCSAGAAPGELLTRPLTLSGRPLRINARTTPRGEIAIRLLDEVGAPLPDLPAIAFSGDTIDGALDAPTEALDRLRGERARLHITCRDADLYSLTI